MNSIFQHLINGETLTIVALGDSLTQGYLVEKGYVDFLGEMLRNKFPASRFQLINKGIPGDTAKGALHRLERDVLVLNPDLIFIEFGLNDAFLGVLPLEFAETLQELVDQIREKSHSRIVMVTSVCLQSQRENDLMNEFYDAMEMVARENDLPIARVHRYWQESIRQGVDFQDLVLEDGLHPTERGYELMAREIFKLFVI